MEKRRLRQKSCSDAGESVAEELQRCKGEETITAIELQRCWKERCRRGAAVHRRRDDCSRREAAVLKRRGSEEMQRWRRGEAASCQTRAGLKPALAFKHGPGHGLPLVSNTGRGRPTLCIKHGPGHGLPFVSNTGQASLWTAPFSGGITLIRDPPTGERNDSPCFRGHRLVE